MLFSVDRHAAFAKVLLTTTALSLLSACSGGSGGGGGGGSSAGGNANPGTAGDPDSFRTAEFNNSSGLDQIRAAEGLAQITGAQGGAGVRIAVIDDGFDLDHPDLAPNVSGQFDPDDFDPAANGTAVAGIIAGAANGSGIQGVAFNAEILPFQFELGSRIIPAPIGIVSPPLINAVDTLNQSVAPLIDSAVDEGASIINVTLNLRRPGPEDTPIVGFPDEVADNLDPLRSSMLDAVQSGALIVSGTGDDTLDDPNFPAAFAADPDLADGMIAVTAVAENNLVSADANFCGQTAFRCLAAPGVDFQGAQPGGGVGDIGNSTAYAAALVSGAAALVQANFDVSPQEAGDRLLDTAEDLGPAGVDTGTGRGLLDLDNALSPQGELSVATSASLTGSKVALSSSKLSLGSSLALNGRGADVLGEAAALDDDNFPFAVDLGGVAQVQSRTTGLEAFVGSDRQRTSVIQTGTGAVILALDEQVERDDPYRAEFAASDTKLQEQAALPRMQMQAEVTDEVDLFFAFNGSSLTEGSLVNTLPNGGGFFQPTAFLAPFDQLVGAQTGGGTTIQLGEDTVLSVSGFASSESVGDRQTSMQKLALSHRTVGDIELRLGYGFMQEDGGFLGSESSGAFGASSGGNSHYLDLSVLAPVTETVSLFGGYTRGTTDASAGGNSLLSNTSHLEADAFGAGVVVTDLAEEGDGFSLMVGQPLRVSDGSADVTVPVGRTPEGDLLRKRGKLDLSPEGREIAIEAVYDVALDDENQSLSAGSFLRLNPDHDPDADPDVGLGLNYSISF